MWILRRSLRKVLQRKLRMCIENSFGHCEMINDYAMKKIGKMVPHLLREKSWTNRGKTNWNRGKTFAAVDRGLQTLEHGHVTGKWSALELTRGSNWIAIPKSLNNMSSISQIGKELSWMQHLALYDSVWCIIMYCGCLWFIIVYD